MCIASRDRSRRRPAPARLLASPILFCLLAAATAQADEPRRPGPAPRFDRWRVIGPGGGGTMVDPTISPHDPDLAFVHCDMTGAYVTTDGGRSWRMLNLRTVAQTFAFDPTNPKVIYAGNVALWRSEDRGVTWRMIWPDPAKNTRQHMVGDHGDFRVLSDDPSHPGGRWWIQSIAVDPTNADRIFLIAGERRGPQALYGSKDRGATWSRIARFDGLRVHLLHIQPTEAAAGGTVYLLSSRGVHRLTGGKWELRPGPKEGIRFGCAGRSRGAAEPTFYAVGAGVAVSTDGGKTWRSADADIAAKRSGARGRRGPRFRTIATAQRDPATAYLSFSGLPAPGDPARTCHGILKTVDTGAHWRIVLHEAGRPSPNMETSHIERRGNGYPNVFFTPPRSLGVAPTDGRICYATDLFRTYRTLDGGATWQSAHSAKVGENHWATRGLDVTTCYGVHFDPFNRRNVFITYTDIGLFASRDGGASWTGATEGIPNLWRNTTYWLAFDPKVRGLLWGAFALNHDLPRPKMWRGRGTDHYKGGVAVSTDGGRRWTVSSDGLPQTAVTHILLEPRSPVGRRTLYAVGCGRGVFKSVDNGKTWTAKNRGVEGRRPLAWRLTRAEDGTLYLLVARRTEDGTLGNDGDGALYKSTDGAENWVKMTLPDGCNGPNALTLDPGDNRRMYLSAWGVRAAEGRNDDTGGGVFLSTDGGKRWKHVLRRTQHVYDVTVDATDPRVLYCCGFDSAAYRSTDRGLTWKRLGGYNFKWGHRVVLDPADPAKIYITTFGGSVWHGPAAGDPDAVGDVVTSQLRLP